MILISNSGSKLDQFILFHNSFIVFAFILYNIKTTQIYAKITKEKISQDMEMLSHKLESFEKQITEII